MKPHRLRLQERVRGRGGPQLLSCTHIRMQTLLCILGGVALQKEIE